MSAPEADGEQVLRRWLRRRLDGPAADEPSVPAPLVQVHVISDPAEPEPEPDDEPEDRPEDDDEPEDEGDQEAVRPGLGLVVPGPQSARHHPVRKD
ncbi:hypothetical protein [Streptomyces sp. NPDC057617]|uniref:hypothetical protein n=1 Tax=Streptomyces sp. NPDC057617 TaxID=3346184 RepID=UPI0036C6708A